MKKIHLMFSIRLITIPIFPTKIIRVITNKIRDNKIISKMFRIINNNTRIILSLISILNSINKVNTLINTTRVNTKLIILNSLLSILTIKNTKFTIKIKMSTALLLKVSIRHWELHLRQEILIMFSMTSMVLEYCIQSNRLSFLVTTNLSKLTLNMNQLLK